jgi:hypothetical protein
MMLCELANARHVASCAVSSLLVRYSIAVMLCMQVDYESLV